MSRGWEGGHERPSSFPRDSARGKRACKQLKARSLVAVIQNSVCHVGMRSNSLHRWFDRDILEVHLQESFKTPRQIEVHQITPRAGNTIRHGLYSPVKG